LRIVKCRAVGIIGDRDRAKIEDLAPLSSDVPPSETPRASESIKIRMMKAREVRGTQPAAAKILT
jgi:hypothetical protein